MTGRRTGASAPESLRKALRASQRLEAQLRQILDLVPDYIFANDTATAATG